MWGKWKSRRNPSDDEHKETERIEREKADATTLDADSKKEVVKELMCHLRIQMRNGRVFEWWNTTWNGVAKKFFLWYSGRPESRHFIMKAKDPEGMTSACIIRSEIVAFETYWKYHTKGESK